MTTQSASPSVPKAGQLELQQLSLQFMESIAAQLAQERQNAIDNSRTLPLGFVFGAGVENFPAKNDDDASGLLVLAVGYISRSDSHAQLEKLFDMVKVQVDNA